jgi:hypothetical protein
MQYNTMSQNEIRLRVVFCIVLFCCLISGVELFTAPRSFKCNSRGTIVLLPATSSSELKEKEGKGRKKKDAPPPPATSSSKKVSVVKRLKQASIRAHAAAAARKNDDKIQDDDEPTASLLDTMKQLDKVIEANKSKASSYQRIGDSMYAVWRHNNIPRPVTSHKREVALLFVKPLYDDRISVEGAGRIRQLVKEMLYEDYEPDLIVFIGAKLVGKNRSNLVADADASYIFFRHLCVSVGLHLRRTEVRLEHHPIDQNALLDAVQYIQTTCKPQWQEAMMSESEPNKDESLKNRRKRLSIHFSLFSSDYQLCQMNDIHLRSPNQSALRALTQLAGSSTSSSWSFHYSSTYSVYYTDPVRRFAAKTFRTAQELVPVLYNLRGVVEDREFFQPENYRVLVSVRSSMGKDMEDMDDQQLPLTSIKQSASQQDTPLDVVLEGALLSLSRCLDIVRPAGTMTGTCPKEDFERALNSLQQAYYLLDRVCDPDSPLPPAEWGVLDTDEIKVQSSSLDE